MKYNPCSICIREARNGRQTYVNLHFYFADKELWQKREPVSIEMLKFFETIPAEYCIEHKGCQL